MFDFNEKDVARWEKKRADGKWRFVLRSALMFALTMAAVTTLLDLVNAQVSWNPIYYLLVLPILGFLAGIIQRWDQEGRYKNYLLDKRIDETLRS